MTFSLTRPMVIGLVAVAVVIGILVTMRLVTPEDAWVCADRQWVKHGQPDTPQPTTPCR